MPRRAVDAALFVKFSRRAVLNQAKSWGEKILDNENNVIEEIKGAGKPILDNVDYIHIEIPGDKNNIVERPVLCCVKEEKPGMHCRARIGPDDKPMLDECDVHRFYDEYVAFKSGQEMHAEGTDLKGWAGIDPASVEELAYYKVYTVEQLAAMNDSVTGKYLQLRQRARDFLEDAKKVGQVANVRAELDARDRALQTEREARQALERQVAELVAAAAKPAPAKGRSA